MITLKQQTWRPTKHLHEYTEWVGVGGKRIICHFARFPFIRCSSLSLVTGTVQTLCSQQTQRWQGWVNLFVIFKFHSKYDSTEPCNIFMSPRFLHREYTQFSFCFWLLLWSSGQSTWLQIHRSRVRFQALLHFLRSTGSGTWSTQPLECNWGATWKKTYRLRSRSPRIRP
jgi:hypothetical protein